MMKKLKEKIGKILIVLCVCLSIGAVAHAEDKATADVEITIEAGEAEQLETLEDNHNLKQNHEAIKTGDHVSWLKYVAILGAAAVTIVCVWKKKKGVLAVLALFLIMLVSNHSVMAADTTECVNVTIPTSISISFYASGENKISEFEVNNQSLVPVTIQKISAIEHNNWSLVEKDSVIPVNTKKLAFIIEGNCLKAGDNSVNIYIAEKTCETLDISVERGAWTSSNATEKALELEFEYTLGKKEFELKFDTNGSNETIDTRKVYNGETVELPQLVRDGYSFAGWEDEEGNLYTNQFVMPIGNVLLKASWKEYKAYAIYSASDTSLRFVKSADVIKAGDVYNGRTVTQVFSGFEENTYASETQVPWYDGNYYNSRIITKIIFEDTIQPKSTAHWFHWAYDCAYMDVRKLDMSNVTDMSYMFAWTGDDASTFTILGVDAWDVSKVTNMQYAFAYLGFKTSQIVVNLSKWNVSKVTNMDSMFLATGYNATTFSLGDLSKWDVSNVINMDGLFMQAGDKATWSLNLSNWNVKNVLYHKCFDTAVETKVIDPKWVN